MVKLSAEAGLYRADEKSDCFKDLNLTTYISPELHNKHIRPLFVAPHSHEHLARVAAELAYKELDRDNNLLQILEEYCAGLGNSIAVLFADAGPSKDRYEYVDGGRSHSVQDWVDWMSAYFLKQLGAVLIGVPNPTGKELYATTSTVIYPGETVEGSALANIRVAKPPKRRPDFFERVGTMGQYISLGMVRLFVPEEAWSTMETRLKQFFTSLSGEAPARIGTQRDLWSPKSRARMQRSGSEDRQRKQRGE